MPPLADIIKDVIHCDACPLDFRATTAIDDLCTHWVPRLSCLMQQRDDKTSGAPQAVHDTAPGLEFCILADKRKEQHIALALIIPFAMEMLHPGGGRLP